MSSNSNPGIAPADRAAKQEFVGFFSWNHHAEFAVDNSWYWHQVPENFTSLDEVITGITGITDEDILDEGKDLKQVIQEIQPLLDKVKVINSYNINFDYNVLLSELYRCHDKNTINKLKNIKKECTLQLATKFLKRDRYLKLEYLYKMLFNHDPKQDHRAFNDAIMCKEVYYKLKEINKNKNKNKSKQWNHTF